MLSASITLYNTPKIEIDMLLSCIQHRADIIYFERKRMNNQILNEIKQALLVSTPRKKYKKTVAIDYRLCA
jgi:hypothetical protein